jgi:hypothetical protein
MECRGHMCLVFERLGPDLSKYMKQHHNQPLPLALVQVRGHTEYTGKGCKVGGSCAGRREWLAVILHICSNDTGYVEPHCAWVQSIAARAGVYMQGVVCDTLHTLHVGSVFVPSTLCAGCCASAAGCCGLHS